jgi:hypothetical protein
MLSRRPSTPARAAASRANGAKSRGPVTAHGKSHSCRNSLRHGLRSSDPLALLYSLAGDPAEITDTIAVLTDEFEPKSERQRFLIRTAAETQSLLFALFRAERTAVTQEMARLAPLHPDVDGRTLLALAFGSLADHSCFLYIYPSIERRVRRKLENLLSRLEELRFLNERTPEIIENTSSRPFRISESELNWKQPGNPTENILLNERTPELAENKRARLKLTLRKPCCHRRCLPMRPSAATQPNTHLGKSACSPASLATIPRNPRVPKKGSARFSPLAAIWESTTFRAGK